MPRTISAEGRTITVPDDATDEEINGLFGPASQPAQPTLNDKRSLWQRATAITPDDPTAPLWKRGVNWLSNATGSALSTGNTLLHGGDPDATPYHPGIATPALPTLRGAMESAEDISHHKVDTSAELAGQAAAMGAPEALDPIGSALKRAGGAVSDVTALGSNALDSRFGARPGMGLSENRIIAGTKAGLKAKVDAAIPKVAATRNATLAASTAAPQSVEPAIDAAFDKANPILRDPNTGVADPAEVRALTRARAAVTFQQDPLTGNPIPNGPGGPPIQRNLSMTPAQMAEFNTDLRSMANYKPNAESPIASEALKGTGHGIREQLNRVAPEAAPLTQQLYNTETAQDILQRQMPANEGGTAVTPSTTAAGMVKNVAAPAIRLAGTATGAGLDALGSGAKSLASKLGSRAGNPPGPPPAGATRPALPPPSAPPPTPGPQGAMPPPQTPPAMPATAGPTVTRTSPQAPPNVSLKERVSGFKRPPAPSAPLGSNVGIPGFRTQGPEGPGQFEISPRRLGPGADQGPAREMRSGTTLADRVQAMIDNNPDVAKYMKDHPKPGDGTSIEKKPTKKKGGK